MTRFTLLIPVRDEAENILPLRGELDRALAGLDYAVIVVDDGSTDATEARLAEIPSWRVITQPPRGKSAALAAGLAMVTTDIVVMLDGDLQDDSAAISQLVADVERGADCAVGCRVQRRDGLFTKRLPSFCFKILIRLLTGRRFLDVNSGLKAFRVGTLRRVRWFNGYHRFLPLLIWRARGSVVERPTAHRPRRHGAGKFNSPWRGFIGIGQLLLIMTGYYDARR